MSVVKVSEIDWERHGGRLLPFDDGHVPETLHTDSHPCQIVEYPKLFQERIPATVHVHSNALPEHLVDAMYDKTTCDLSQPAWGDYVTMDQVQNYWNKQQQQQQQQQQEMQQNYQQDQAKATSATVIQKEFPISSLHPQEDDLLVAVVAHYLELAMDPDYDSSSIKRYVANETGGNSGNCIDVPQQQQQQQHALWTRDDLKMVHGVAIWGLAAKTGSQVPYHLDYAEQVRYDSNIIVPPLLAGTLQCTRNKLEGGDFCVSLQGISHYRQYGYKGQKKQQQQQQQRQASSSGNHSTMLQQDMISIPYQYNQLTIHLGNLPHLSTRIDAIHPINDPQQQHSAQPLRVIVGFNVFGFDVGPIVAKAPEHSHSFRRKVQMQRALLSSSKLLRNTNSTHSLDETSTIATTTTSTSITPQQSLSLQAIQRNKPLTKLLVLAKRERIKQEYQMAQEYIAKELPKRVPATVQELMDYFYPMTTDKVTTTTTSSSSSSSSGNGGGDWCWPACPMDVQVYLNREIQQRRYQIIHHVQSTISSKNGVAGSSLVSPLDTIDIIVPPQ